MITPTNHKTLIKALGGAAKVAEILGIASINVRQWSARDRIPPEHWAKLIEAADSPRINADWLLETMPDRKPPTPAAQVAA